MPIFDKINLASCAELTLQEMSGINTTRATSFATEQRDGRCRTWAWLCISAYRFEVRKPKWGLRMEAVRRRHEALPHPSHERLSRVTPSARMKQYFAFCITKRTSLLMSYRLCLHKIASSTSKAGVKIVLCLVPALAAILTDTRPRSSDVTALQRHRNELLTGACGRSLEAAETSASAEISL
jgi:hypothetical protein